MIRRRHTWDISDLEGIPRMSSPIVLGIDLGTQQLKVIAVDGATAAVMGSAQTAVENLTPAPGWLEQVPDDWWTALCRLTRELKAKLGISAEAIAGIGLSGHMHSIVPLRADGSIAHNCIVWADTRSKAQAQRLADTSADKLWNPSIAPYSLNKILWLQERLPRVFAEVSRFLFSKDYLRYRMTGELGTDPSDASGSLMWDFAKREWDAALLAEFDLAPSLLPPVQASSEIAGTLSAEAARDLGLSPGTTVAYGGGDCPCAVVGAGIPAADTLLINAGTAVQVIEMRDKPSPFDPVTSVRYLFELGIEGKCFAIGALNSAGHSLEWWRALVDERLSYAEFDALAAETPSTPDGPLFLPYLQGTGTPYLRDGAYGSFVQLSATADQPTLTRAVMDGVAFGIKHCAEALVSEDSLANKIILFTGGVPKSPLMREILANVFGGEIRCLAFSDMSALGAAAHAAVAGGINSDARAFLADFDYGEITVKATPALQEQYTASYERYKVWAERIAGH